MNYYQVLQALDYLESLYSNHYESKQQIAQVQQVIDHALRNDEDCEVLQERKFSIEKDMEKQLYLISREEQLLIERVHKDINEVDKESPSSLLTLILNAIKTETGFLPKKDKKELPAEINPVPASIFSLHKKYNKYCDTHVYKSLLPYTKLAYYFESKGNAELHAYKLATLFGNKKKALEYIKKYGTLNFFKLRKMSDFTLVHDALLFTLPPEDKCDFKAWSKLARHIDYMLDFDFREMLAVADVIEKAILQDNEISNAKLHHKCTLVRETEIARITAQRMEITNLKKQLAPKLREWRMFKANQEKYEHRFVVNLQKLAREISALRLELVKVYSGTSWAKAELEMFRCYYEYHITQRPSIFKSLKNKCAPLFTFFKNTNSTNAHYAAKKL